MKISIVTACFNSADTISDTLRTIKMQTHKDIEHIVVDGGSTDGTLEILEKNKADIAYLISGPDNGLYDAMNKGLIKATGDVIGLLNSDDLFASSEALSLVVNALADDSVDACFGDLVYVANDDINKVARYWKSSPYKKELFANGWVPAHPTFYVKKGIHEKYGMLFNTDYKLAADFEVLLRLLYKHKINAAYIPEVMVKMRLGGATNQSIKNIINQNKEIMRAFADYNYPYSATKFFVHKLVDRLKQYSKKVSYV